MEKLETIQEWKPNKMTNFLLFVLFSLLILRILDWLKYYTEYGFELVADYEECPPSAVWLAVFVWVAIIAGEIMSFKTITLMLSGNRECVFSMRLCLVHIIITQTIISPYWNFPLPLILTNLYLLFFLGYMLFAKKIKQHFPKPERRIRANGIIWIVLIVMYLIPTLSIMKYLKKVASAPNTAYEYRETNDLENEEFYLNRVDSADTYMILAGQYTSDSPRAHNLILYEMMAEIKNDSVSELEFADTAINGNRVISTTIGYNGSELRIVTVFDPESQKMVGIVGQCTASDSIINAVDFSLKEGILKDCVEKIQESD